MAFSVNKPKNTSTFAPVMNKTLHLITNFKNTRYFLIFIGIVLLSSCSTLRHLEEGETYLKKNTIHLKHAKKVHNKTQLKWELSTVYAQRPNRKFFGFSRRWHYYWTKNKKKKGKFAKWVSKTIAEPPAIFDSTLVEESRKNILYKMEQKGYFDTEVTSTVKYNRFRKASVDYYIVPHQQLRIDSIFLVCPDTAISQILKDHQKESLLQPGVVLNLENYNAEVLRIVRLLRNNGYAKFNQSHIAKLDMDTTGSVNLTQLEIFAYQDSLPHPIFHIGEISVFHQSSVLGQQNIQRDTIIDGIKFSPTFFDVKSKAIRKKITIKQNQKYQIDKIEESQKLLNKLSYYKSIVVSHKQSPIDTLMDINILLSPKKKMSIGYLFDLNNSNFSSSGQTKGSFLGIGANINFTHRNIFHKSELLQLSANGGVDVALKTKQPISSSNFTFSGNLFFPNYITPIPYINFGKMLKNRKLNQLSQDVRKFSQSRISTSISFVKIPDWYDYQIVKVSMGINYQGKNGSQMSVANMGFDYFNPQPSTNFINLANEFPYLQRSFSKQLFTGLFFKQIHFSSPIHHIRGQSTQWAGDLEVSGVEIGIINKAYNLVTGKEEIFRLGKGDKNLTDYSKFAKLSLQTTLKTKTKNNQTIGALIRVGAAVPFGDAKSVPYVSQFYGGGPNSVRGWRIRELGPGGFIDPIASDPTYLRPYYQSGDVKFEWISEWRFNIYWRFKGAIFLDAGNVWAFQKDPGRPNAEISNQFYKQLAVGTGAGIRFDMTYFILRFDMGLKIRNPYLSEQNKYWIDYGGFFRKTNFKDFNLNIQVGYPF